MIMQGYSSILDKVQSWIIIFFLLDYSEIMCQYSQLENPCPDTFQYQFDRNNDLYGVIIVQSPNSQRIQLDIELSIGNSVRGYNGRIELAYSKDRVIDDVSHRRPIKYNVYFPTWFNIPPKITKIAVNGNLVCYGPKLTFGAASIITTVNLQHVLRVDVQTLTYPNSGNNYISSQDDTYNMYGGGNDRPPPPGRGPPPPGRGPPPDDRPPPENDEPPPDYGRPDDYNRPRPNGHRRPPPPPPPDDEFGNNRYNFKPEPNKNQNKPNRFNFKPEMPDDPSKIYSGNPFLASTEGTPLLSTTSFSFFGNQPIDSDEKTDAPVIEFESKNQNSDASLDSVCGRSVSTNQLVFGGNAIPRGAFPWLSALFGATDRGLSYLCTGSLISDRHVVSAAHCVKIDNRVLRNQELLIILGKQNIQKWVVHDGEKMVEPESIHVHPNYNTSTSDADISVIVLSERIQFTRYIRPICLWSGNTDLHNIEGQLGTVVGWGKDENGVIMTAEPKRIQMPVVSQDECLRSSYQFKDITSSRTFCAGFKNNTGPCNGDSGGGFMMEIEGRWRLRGIVSMSVSETHERTCNLKHYVVFTDASKHLEWIQSFLK